MGHHLTAQHYLSANLNTGEIESMDDIALAIDGIDDPCFDDQNAFIQPERIEAVANDLGIRGQIFYD